MFTTRTGSCSRACCPNIDLQVCVPTGVALSYNRRQWVSNPLAAQTRSFCSESWSRERNAIAPRHTIQFCMNPNENDFTRDEPLPAQQFQPREEDIRSTGREQFHRAKEEVSTQMSQTWDQTKEKASLALERTEDFMRENPVPTILGALGLGIAIGLAIRYAAPGERKREIVVESPFGKFN